MYLFRRLMNPAPLAAAWVALTSCGDSAPGHGWTAVRDTLPSGTVRVTNIPLAEAPPTWTLVEEVRVGAVEGAGPDAFGHLKGLVVLGDGGFAVLEAQVQELRVFGPDGAHVATHGGKGEGPGEFANANGLMRGPNGRIWVPDTRNGRMSVFDPEDGFVESFPFADGNFNSTWNGAMVDGDRIYRPWRSGNRARLHVYDLTMTRVDSLPLQSRGPEDEEFDPTRQPGAFYQEMGGGYMMYGIPYYPSEVRHIDPRGAFWSTRDGDPEYRLKKWVPGGDTTLVVETRRPSVAVPAVARDSVIDMMRRIVSNIGGAEWDWSRVPTIRPPSRHLRIGRGQPVGPHPVRRRRRPVRRLLGRRCPSRHGQSGARPQALQPGHTGRARRSDVAGRDRRTRRALRRARAHRPCRLTRTNPSGSPR